MKKYKYFLIIMVIILIVPIIIKFFTKKHNISYKKNNYNIQESFHIDDGIHSYDFNISNNKESYSYTLKENVNKNKKIINKINVYKEKNITCIVPIYKKKLKLNIYCLKDNKQVSNYYLRDDKNYKKIIEKTKKFDIETPTSSNSHKKYKKLNVYQKNILEDNAFILWDYKGIYVLKEDELLYHKFIDYDIYDNVMNAVTKRYYVLFENDDVMGIEKVHYYDIKKDKHNTFKIKTKISKQSYINGVIKDSIYVTDTKKKVQYLINIKKKTIEEIGNEELGYTLYKNNEKELLNKSDFFMHEQLFANVKEKNKKISKSESIKEGNYYYFIENNKFYKQLNSYSKILLFEQDNIDYWYIYNDNIIMISDSYIYLYNDITGLRKIVKYNELKYNGKNIVKFWG